MPDIPVDTPLGFLGVFSLILGIFLILSGFNILKVEKVSVTSGTRTWGFGIVLAVLGIVFLLPDISGSLSQPPTQTPTVAVANAVPTETPIPPTNTPLPPTSIVSPPIDWDQKKCTLPVVAEFKATFENYKNHLGCPLGIAYAITRIAEQAFQGGHLFWREDKNEVYIVYDKLPDGTELFAGDWFKAPPDWQWDGSYPDGVGLSPPSNDLFEPVRGFGWLWRTHLTGPEGKLGWAVDKEYGFENIARVQDFERGFLFRASSPKIYIFLDTNEFFATE